jgi:hypothetical protein
MSLRKPDGRQHEPMRAGHLEGARAVAVTIGVNPPMCQSGAVHRRALAPDVARD